MAGPPSSPRRTIVKHRISGLVQMQKDTQRLMQETAAPMGNTKEWRDEVNIRGQSIYGEATNDPTENIAKGAVKYDAGKAPVFRGLIDYFPRAVEAVAQVSNFGASKYAWKGWQDVPDGIARYSDGLVRHLTSEGKGEILDGDSGLRHAAHAAWNSLARLELMLREKEYGKCES